MIKPGISNVLLSKTRLTYILSSLCDAARNVKKFRVLSTKISSYPAKIKMINYPLKLYKD